MDNRFKQLILILFIGIFLFYGMPLLAYIIPSNIGMFFFIIVLMFLNPLYSFISSKLITKKYGFRWYIPILLGVLFTPTVFIYYNSTAYAYIIAYMIISLIGSIIGSKIHKTPMNEMR